MNSAFSYRSLRGKIVADTSFQKHFVEPWIRSNWLPEKYGTLFTERILKLASGGSFKFDAVNEGGTIAACISTSRCKTASSNYGTGKMHKLRSDMLYLYEAEGVEQRLIILTEDDMFLACLSQRRRGRIPLCIEFLHVPLPSELRASLDRSREISSAEVTPSMISRY